VVCNSGVGLTPVIDGSLFHFSAGGLYNGLVLLIDDETRSYWDHITGRAVHGPLKGKQMAVWGIQLTTVGRALADTPDLLLLTSRQSFSARLLSWFFSLSISRSRIPPGFRRTMGPLDRRLPEMEIGLGVIANSRQCFYPLVHLGDEIEDHWQGAVLHIAVNPRDGIPEAFFPDGSRPLQMFTRWYGFSFTYPKSDIFPGKRCDPAGS